MKGKLMKESKIMATPEIYDELRVCVIPNCLRINK